MKYLIIITSIIWGIFFYTNAKAEETVVTNEQFAFKVKSCVQSLYADKTKYPLTKQVPLELIIAQAAHESAWGNSRFAVQGNNLFGIRTWNPEDPQLKAKGAPDAPWGVRTYTSWCASVEHYLHIIDTLPVYSQFREELQFQREVIKSVTPINLALYLASWSEQGPEYVRLLQSIMLSLYQKEFYKKIT